MTRDLVVTRQMNAILLDRQVKRLNDLGPAYVGNFFDQSDFSGVNLGLARFRGVRSSQRPLSTKLSRAVARINPSTLT